MRASICMQEVTRDADGVKRVVYGQRDKNNVAVLGATVMAFFKPPTAPAPYAVLGAVYPAAVPETASLVPVAQATAALQQALPASMPAGAKLGPIAQDALADIGTAGAAARPDVVIVPGRKGQEPVMRHAQTHRRFSSVCVCGRVCDLDRLA